MSVLQGYVKIEDQEIFYRESGRELREPKGNALLLHGMRFSSSNWEEILTLSKLCEWNYHAFAIDLPGFGKSKEAKEPKHKSAFLKDLCEALKIYKVILISPSMSGAYSVPFIHDFPSLLQAYIPVAPISTEKFTIQQYKTVQVPTFIVYGENDNMSFVDNAIKLLNYIPNSSEMRMKNAGHACYLDQPDSWHQHLNKIISSLK